MGLLSRAMRRAGKEAGAAWRHESPLANAAIFSAPGAALGGAVGAETGDPMGGALAGAGLGAGLGGGTAMLRALGGAARAGVREMGEPRRIAQALLRQSRSLEDFAEKIREIEMRDPELARAVEWAAREM